MCDLLWLEAGGRRTDPMRVGGMKENGKGRVTERYEIMRRGISILAVASLTGCLSYSTPQSRVVENNWVVSAGFDRVWDAAIDAFADNSWPIATIDRSSGIIVAEDVGVLPTFMDCGVTTSRGEMSYAYNFTSFNVVIRQEDSSPETRLRVNTGNLRGGVRTLGGIQDRDCVSTGLAEALIHDTILRKLDLDGEV